MKGSRASSSTDIDECMAVTSGVPFLLNCFPSPDSDDRGRLSSSTPQRHLDDERRGHSSSSTPGGNSRASSTGRGAGIDMYSISHKNMVAHLTVFLSTLKLFPHWLSGSS